MPEISITGVFGVKPAAREAVLMVSATAAEAASPTAPHFSQIRNTTGSLAFVIVHAGDKRIAAFDAVHEALFAQEIERAIDRDRRRSRPARRQPVDQLIGAEWRWLASSASSTLRRIGVSRSLRAVQIASACEMASLAQRP